MFTKLFWKDAAERASKTFAQDLLAPLLVAGAGSALHLPWQSIATNAAVAALISVLSSVVSLPVSGNGTASLLRSVTSVSPGRHEVTPTTPEV